MNFDLKNCSILTRVTCPTVEDLESINFKVTQTNLAEIQARHWYAAKIKPAYFYDNATIDFIEEGTLLKCLKGNYLCFVVVDGFVRVIPTRKYQSIFG